MRMWERRGGLTVRRKCNSSFLLPPPSFSGSRSQKGGHISRVVLYMDLKSPFQEKVVSGKDHFSGAGALTRVTWERYGLDESDCTTMCTEGHTSQ